ncbi:hypothetical protein AMST5_04244 [freshwater sediment metagenome]|uniref:Uncharacterized protein n=1 Tax=freshwater sediment metagenome TaxID=556182 RepID=A0AA48M3H1_9ZZZZ
MELTADTIANDAAERTTVNEVAENPLPTTAKSHRVDLEPAYRVTDPARGTTAGHGKAFMLYEGQVIGESKEPAFDAARWLLKRGLALPSDRLTTYRDGTPCVFTTVGRAATLSVRDNARCGVTLCAYREPSPETLKALRQTKVATA